MTAHTSNPGRRRFLQATGAVSLMVAAPWAWPRTSGRITRRIPGTDEAVPVIGMGSWGTFDIGSSQRLRGERVKVLRQFFEQGGTLIDSSPMYGSSEENIGYCLGFNLKNFFCFC